MRFHVIQKFTLPRPETTEAVEIGCTCRLIGHRCKTDELEPTGMLMAPDADCPLHGSGGRRSQLTKLTKQPFRNVVNLTAVNDILVSPRTLLGRELGFTGRAPSRLELMPTPRGASAGAGDARAASSNLGTISTVGSRPLRRLKTAGSAEAPYAALLACLELQRDARNIRERNQGSTIEPR
jgi:hypothetical protein